MNKTIIYVYEPSGIELSERIIKHGQYLQEFCSQNEKCRQWDYIIVDHSGIRCNRHVLITMALDEQLKRVIIKSKKSLGGNQSSRNEIITCLLENNVEILTPNRLVKMPELLKLF
ncbi:hypothetical protein ACLIBH_05365 [Virgibacillus sp. W0430]|uniref:hypothetical protein n=1 Tax=Virgibacillus sp. W0430 TaxID=3391580 RepID=UPI003F446D85